MPHPRVLIDASALPHVFGSILDALIAILDSSPGSRARKRLLALRQLDRATRDRVDIRLSYVLDMHNLHQTHPAFVDLRFPSSLVGEWSPPQHDARADTAPASKRARIESSTRALRSQPPPPPFSLDSARDERARHARALLKHTRILDIDITPAHLLLRDACPNLQCLRLACAHGCAPCVTGQKLPPTVCFRRLAAPLEREGQHFRSMLVETSRLTWSVSFHATDMAQLHARGGAAWAPSPFFSDMTAEFIFLFVPAPTRSLRPRVRGAIARPRTARYEWRDYREPSGALGVLEDIVYHMAPALERTHVFVGLEAMPPAALGLADGLAPDAVFDAVRKGIEAAFRARRRNPRDRLVRDDLWPDPLVDECVQRVRILTLDAYRAEVGEERYAWETTVRV
ncbi:hypothetical protein CC85DRAFT_286572 [Cutaneotrichosporon oleaginosum]|uniref:Uncharacterized protein n=1 Tax=Cutaneotrichosporon oleaginosum TaxID=879819 RepID=A0A0J1B1D1_9TREE|nr:uncharacterized protein CC85DRAFT_286572 [Cutaneotrichosporon oleaginosum]KLT41394.1 hypothetical protein CC85DRAFT_286572 [Cutaneotrichosporon oleaginosum]TXT06335.1 hypothetical protein COLE_05666 [Cutaneotrichosporon oleaginosum]